MNAYPFATTRRFILGSTPVSGVGFGVSPKQSFKFVKPRRLHQTPETGVLPNRITVFIGSTGLMNAIAIELNRRYFY